MDTHFKKEHRIVKLYKVFFYTCICFLSLFMLVFPACMIRDSHDYLDSPVTLAITYMRIFRSVIITVTFLSSSFKLLREIRIGYHDLLQTYCRRMTAIGLSLLICLIFILYFNSVILIDQTQLQPRYRQARFYKWIEFLAEILPVIFIAAAYPPVDLFARFNKYPEQISRVSIFQYEENSATRGDIFGFLVNRGVEQVDTDLALAN